MIDLSAMRGVRVDPVRAARAHRARRPRSASSIARRWPIRPRDHRPGPSRTPAPAGLTLGGGFGRLAREYGLTCDNVAVVDVVTADGQLRHASDAENTDLFWALARRRRQFRRRDIVRVPAASLRRESVRRHARPLLGAGAGRDAKRSSNSQRRAPDEFWAEFDPDRRGRRNAGGDHRRVLLRPEQSGARIPTPPRSASRCAAVLDRLRTATCRRAATRLRATGCATTPSPGFVTGIDAEAARRSVRALRGSARIARPRWLVRAEGRRHRARRARCHGVLASRPAHRHRAGRRRGSGAGRGQHRLGTLHHGRDRKVHRRRVCEHARCGIRRSSRSSTTYGGNYERLAASRRRYDPGNLLRLNANIKPHA